MPNINDTYFDGLYKEVWRSMIPDQLTAKEVAFILNYFKLTPGQRVLDIMCGFGRHSIALSREGLEVTAVDNLGDYVAEIEVTARKEALSLKAVKSDIISYQPDGIFDLVICMGNSLNFFSATEMEILFKTLSQHLPIGGKILINSWSIAEIAFRQFVPESESTVNGTVFTTKSEYLLDPSRIETETSMLSPHGVIERKLAIDYIVTINELNQILKNQGFQITEVFSVPGKRKFTLGDPRAYIIVTKQ
jgi:cyclopropane fatty-acyl-phospholipid synthase-like methyltransferase